MKTIKTILMIALFSMVTISCTDLITEDMEMQNPPIENITNPDNTDTNTLPNDDGNTGGGNEASDDATDPDNSGGNGSGKGN